MKTSLLKGFALSALLAASPLYAADYAVDTSHAFANFKIGHLGLGTITGRFNTFDGSFSYDAEKPEASKITLKFDVGSIDTNHAERNKHLRGDKYLNVAKYPEATFTSTSFTPNAEGGVMKGDLTLYGNTKEITVDVKKVGEGKDPWGNYRVGFSGKTTFKLEDFGMKFNLGPASESITMKLYLEGIKK